MNWKQIEGSWSKAKGNKDKWGKLTDDELDIIDYELRHHRRPRKQQRWNASGEVRNNIGRNEK